MTGTPIWFGPSDRPLFGMLHVPEGNTARAGVVLCSPLVREDLYVHSAYRTLAERLEQHGIAVLRFDYDGTGDSAGAQHDPARVAAWAASTRAAFDLMRSAGPPVVAAVGMRMGATLAALEATRFPLDALVLWDPCRSGRTFLREQRALHALSVGGLDLGDGSVQTPGFRYDAETAADLSALDITRTEGPMAVRVFLLTRPDRQHDAKLDARLASAGHVESGTALGQHELLTVDGRLNAGLEDTLERLVTWLSTVAAPDPAPFDTTPFDPTTTSAVVAHDAKSRPIVERTVRFGSGDLFGIVTEPAGESSPTTVVCFNTGKSRRIGPSRLWVELARQWAACGLRTLRVDLSGLGDSGTHPGQLRDIYYPFEALADVEEVAQFVSPDDPSRVVLVGLCSGAYHAVHGGLSLGAQGVCVFNPIFTTRPIPFAAISTTSSARPQLSAPARRWAARLAGHQVPRAVLGALPEGAWWIFNRLGIRRSPVDSLEQLVDAGSDVLVVVGGDESFRIRRGSARALRSLSRSDRLQFEVIDDLDHAMLGARDARRVSDIVYSHVRDRFGKPDPVDEAVGRVTMQDPDDSEEHSKSARVADVADVPNSAARVDETSRS
jgi:alpha-beta hydrolase superfamily lysophospholipase